MRAFDSKVLSTFVLENTLTECNDEIFVAACENGGTIRLWRVTANENDIDIDEIGSFLLPYCKQRWAVACKLISFNNKDSINGLALILIVGDRNGSIHVFHADKSAISAVYESYHIRLLSFIGL